MPLTWDLSKVKDASTVCYQYLPADAVPPNLPEEGFPEELGWERSDEDGSLSRLCPKTTAIIFSTLHVGIPELHVDTLTEFYYRLNALFDAGLGFLHSRTPEGSVPIPISYGALRAHLGMKTNCKPMTCLAFDKYVRSIRMKALEHHLSNPKHLG